MAIRTNLIIDQGSDYITNINAIDDDGEPLDLADYVGYSHFKKYEKSIYFYRFDVETFANGQISLSMNSKDTASAEAGRYQFDCFLENTTSNTIFKVLEGIVTVVPRMTIPCLDQT